MTASDTALSRVLVATASYNESENIRPFCEKVLGLRPQVDLLVVDDGSPDGTGDILREMAKTEPRIRVLGRPGKQGLGTAHLLAWLYAAVERYDVLVTMDCDMSHDPLEIPALLAELEEADFVMGSRYAPGGKSDYGFVRHSVSVVANKLTRLLISRRLHEFTTSFRAFRVSCLPRLEPWSIKVTGYGFFLESSVKALRSGIRVREVPIHFRDRASGISKIPRMEITRALAILMRLTADRRRGKPPKGMLVGEALCPRCQAKWTLSRGPNSEEAECLCCGHHFARQGAPGLATPLLVW